MSDAASPNPPPPIVTDESPPPSAPDSSPPPPPPPTVESPAPPPQAEPEAPAPAPAPTEAVSPQPAPPSQPAAPEPKAPAKGAGGKALWGQALDAIGKTPPQAPAGGKGPEGKGAPQAPTPSAPPPPPEDPADYSNVHEAIHEMDSVIASLLQEKRLSPSYYEDDDEVPASPPISSPQGNFDQDIIYRTDETPPPALSSQEAVLIDALELIQRQNDIVTELQSSAFRNEMKAVDREVIALRNQVESLITQLSESQLENVEYKRKYDLAYSMYQQCLHSVHEYQKYVEEITQQNAELQLTIQSICKPSRTTQYVQTEIVVTKNAFVDCEILKPPRDDAPPPEQQQPPVPTTTAVPPLTRTMSAARIPSDSSQSLQQQYQPQPQYTQQPQQYVQPLPPASNVFSWLSGELGESLPPTPDPRTPTPTAPPDTCYFCGNINSPFCGVTGKRHKDPSASPPRSSGGVPSGPETSSIDGALVVPQEGGLSTSNNHANGLHNVLRKSRDTLTILQADLARASTDVRPSVLQKQMNQSAHSKQMRSHYRAILTHFYSRHNPAKINEIEQILDLFQGNENELLMLLAMKYEQHGDHTSALNLGYRAGGQGPHYPQPSNTMMNSRISL